MVKMRHRRHTTSHAAVFVLSNRSFVDCGLELVTMHHCPIDSVSERSVTVMIIHGVNRVYYGTTRSVHCHSDVHRAEQIPLLILRISHNVRWLEQRAFVIRRRR